MFILIPQNPRRDLQIHCFIQTSVENPKDIQFTIKYDKEKQHMLTFEKLKLEIV